MPTANTNVCAAVERSPKYSGSKLEKATSPRFRKWVATTNLTLDNLKCPKGA